MTTPQRAAVLAVLAAIVGIVAAPTAVAQETVAVSVPAGVDFVVADVGRSTAGAPSPTRISFSGASLDTGKALRLSVQADTATFEAPSGTPVPASLVSWTTQGASGGIGWNGNLGSTAFALVFQSTPGLSSAHIDLVWLLAPPGGGIRAGMHQLTIRWKIESISP